VKVKSFSLNKALPLNYYLLNYRNILVKKSFYYLNKSIFYKCDKNVRERLELFKIILNIYYKVKTGPVRPVFTKYILRGIKYF